MHVTFLLIMVIYLAREAQIALLLTKEVTIPKEYFDFINVFLEKKSLMLLKITDLNQYAIELQKY